jgi:hypothetical protein
MDSAPLQRRITFGLIVLVLLGLAVYLISPAARGSGRPAPTRTPRSASPQVARSPAQGPPPGSSVPASAGGPDIYQWLPFSQAGLAAAASVARKFGAAYGTFSYTETAAAYVAPLQPLTSASLTGQIEAAYSLPSMAAARSTAKQVSAGTAVIESIRAFGPTSLTFVVSITEQQTTASGSSSAVTSYALTVTGSGSAWQVTDIELAQLGNS